MRIPCWLFAVTCAISFIIGRRSSHGGDGREYPSFLSKWSNDPGNARRHLTQQHGDSDDDIVWELNMRRARSFSGISIPQNNGYSAKCIPDNTLQQMNANIKRVKLNRTNLGLMDGQFHYDVPHFKQVGEFVFNTMRYDRKTGRPIWTNQIWNHLQHELKNGTDGGPPHYKKSGKSISNAVAWVLQNTLDSCGVSSTSPCQMSIFSAISPWAEAILYWSAASQLPPRKTKLTSVDFNPCILEDIPKDIISECRSPLSFLKRPDTTSLFDLTVSYSGIEHDGLGRYNDPINPDGDISAMREMWLLTRPGGVLLLAVPKAGQNHQPRTALPIWGNKKIQILQHRAYGAERYMRLLAGWALEGFVASGNNVITTRSNDDKLTSIARMIECSILLGENQPLLILRKVEGMIFDNVLSEDENWTETKALVYEEEYRAIQQNVTCYDNDYKPAKFGGGNRVSVAPKSRTQRKRRVSKDD